MLSRKFELIPIKIGFFTNFLSRSKSGQSPCTIVHGLHGLFHKKNHGLQ